MYANNFNIGDDVVYPAHGVGKIMGQEVQVVSSSTMPVYVIFFQKDKMTIKVPVAKAVKSGLRHVEPSDTFTRDVMGILKCKYEIPKAPWAKRAQEYEARINSGKVDMIARVLRELHRTLDSGTNYSYGERVIYTLAMDRLAQEYSISMSISKEDAISKITAALNYFQD